jgi:DNA-binding HxlR family transcriptional regulator
MEKESGCPAQALLKKLSGKWKPEVFKLAVDNTVRFSTLLREIKGSNKQTLSVALRELEEVGLLQKIIVQQKPLHVAYSLSEAWKLVIPIFKQLEGLR